MVPQVGFSMKRGGRDDQRSINNDNIHMCGAADSKMNGEVMISAIELEIL